MKRFFKVLSLALLFAITVPAVSNAERVPMPVEKMPAQVQYFLNDYYPGVTVQKSWAKMMRAETVPMWYRVNLSNGTKLAFDLQGNWYEVNAKKASAPASIDLLPNDARKVISEKYPNATISKIKFKKDQYKITLSDGMKLKFDKSYGQVTKNS